jgi:hypothetical protein
MACLLVVMPVYGQTAANEDAAIQAAIETARADLKADKKTIVTEAMQFSAADAKAFWPVYDKYQASLDTLNNERIAMMKEYVDKFWTLNDAEAGALTKRYFDWQTRRNDLRKQYFDTFVHATSGTTAAKFFQVEHRLDLVLDLKVAAGLPGLFMKADAAKK